MCVVASLSPQKREAKRNNNVVYARASGKESDSQKMSEGSKATVEKQVPWILMNSLYQW